MCECVHGLHARVRAGRGGDLSNDVNDGVLAKAFQKYPRSQRPRGVWEGRFGRGADVGVKPQPNQQTSYITSPLPPLQLHPSQQIA